MDKGQLVGRISKLMEKLFRSQFLSTLIKRGLDLQMLV